MEAVKQRRPRVTQVIITNEDSNGEEESGIQPNAGSFSYKIRVAGEEYQACNEY